MKRSRNDPLTMAVAELLLEHLEERLTMLKPDFVAPVPMHWLRRLRRTTNSPDLLAALIAQRLRCPWHPRSVVRTRSTQPQNRLSPTERRRNVRGAFTANRSIDWADKRVLLVDDVLTTGSTCSEIAATLKKSGATVVNVVVVARAQGQL
ncbi:MAG TPA: phosphoribosyltransferase family protein [Pirellulales bacterium]|nr:phosphoribosyltransferase family protein [Pirellulales bacterium]